MCADLPVLQVAMWLRKFVTETEVALGSFTLLHRNAHRTDPVCGKLCRFGPEDAEEGRQDRRRMAIWLKPLRRVLCFF